MRKALRRECLRLTGVSPIVTDLLRIPGGSMPWEFRRARVGKAEDGYRWPCGYFRLKFAEPVGGPVSLGYASHFGLGPFFPM